MKPLNRQQRKAAIWKFIILYLITIVLIIIPFLFLGKFSDSHKEKLRNESNKDLTALNKCKSDYDVLMKDRNNINNQLVECKRERKELNDDLEDAQKGIKVSTGQERSAGITTNSFGELTGKYDKVSRRFGNFIREMNGIKGDNYNQMTEAKYNKLDKSLDSLTQVQKDLSNLNDELKELSK